MKPYRLVLADDHVIFRQGIKGLLSEKPDLEVIGEAGSGLELINLFHKGLRPDMVILDISMPDLRGIEAAEEIKSICPAVKILILTMHKSKEYLYHCISSGAHGYMLKEDSDVELFSAIETIRKGDIFVSRLLTKELAEDLSHIYQGEMTPAKDPLTPREREILKMVAEGKQNKDISDLLFISIRTVENHRANIMSKLKFKKTADLIRYAIQKGYIAKII
ncbi:MAG TPA: response regulator transcription factor [Candidatus Deferrimicrobium sp.]|nr:response regulator transcription factor [Candidatus Deferrimicrobium sp.]